MSHVVNHLVRISPLDDNDCIVTAMLHTTITGDDMCVERIVSKDSVDRILSQTIARNVQEAMKFKAHYTVVVTDNRVSYKQPNLL
jgi:hypothetical protein